MALTTFVGQRRASRVAVAAACLVVAATPQMAAAGAPLTYVVSAQRSSSVDVVFDRSVVVQMGRTRVSGSGAYAGYYLQPLDRRGDQGVGELRMAEYVYPSFERLGLPLGGAAIQGYGGPTARSTATPRLPAGRYRVHVIGDRATRLTLALMGVRTGRRLTATRPSPLSLSWADSTPSAVGGTVSPRAVVADVPVTVRSAASLTLLSLFIVRRAVPAEALAAVTRYCLGSPDTAAACQLPDPNGYHPSHGSGYAYDQWRLAQPPAESRAVEGVASYYGYGSAAAGERVAHFEVATPATLDKVVVLAFSLAY